MVSCLATSHSAVAAAQASGGSYMLTIDGGKPITLTSLDFGESNASTGGGAGKAKFSPVTVTTATGAEALSMLMTACFAGRHFTTVVATYKDAQGKAQFEVDFKMVYVSSVTLPAVDKASSPPGDMAWMFFVGAEEIKTQSQTGGTAGAQVGGKPIMLSRLWRGSLTRPGVAPSGKFGFTLNGVDTSGVLMVSPFVISSPAEGSSGAGAGKVTFSPLNLTVDATKAADFTKWFSSGRVVSGGVLTYNRKDDAGQQESIALDLKLLFIKSCNFAGNAGSAPVYHVQLTYGGLAVKTTTGGRPILQRPLQPAPIR